MSQLSGQLGAIVDFADLAGALLAVRSVTGARVGVSDVIKRVIDEAAFAPVFQPIVDMLRHRTVGYEALTRFTDGVPPDVRFADAVAVGLGNELELRHPRSRDPGVVRIAARPLRPPQRVAWIRPFRRGSADVAARDAGPDRARGHRARRRR